MINRFPIQKKSTKAWPQLIRTPSPLVFSFNIRQDRVPNINSDLHFHPEVELIHLHEGKGIHFVGDNVRAFNKGDILLIGSNLPHCFKFQGLPTEYDREADPCSTVIHFREDFWGKAFLNLPENRAIKLALEQAKRGVLLSAAHEPTIEETIRKMVHAEGHHRIILLIDILSLIAASTGSQQLASAGFNYSVHDGDRLRLSRVYDYTYAHFQQPISLDSIAKIANLAPNAFCRYFKKTTSRTFVQFLNEIKVCHACKCLAETDMSVKEICYNSGFNNFSSFHEAFKKSKGVTPLEFRNNFF